MIKIQVITKIPDLDKSDGNLADDILVKGVNDGEVCYFPYKRGGRTREYIEIKVQVFELGEIIIVNDIGREIGGIERKADKWNVEYKEFHLKDIEKAIRLSEQLMLKK